jgi:hypothetical protein
LRVFTTEIPTTRFTELLGQDALVICELFVRKT